MVIGKALFNTQHYSFFLYKQCVPAPSLKPDILYSTKDEGEILIEWDSDTKQLCMRIFVDITNVYSKKHKYAMNLVSKLEQVNHPNILNLLEPVMLIDVIQTLVFKTEAPDHISTWKQFCKYQFSNEEVLCIFRQLATGIAHLHSLGIIHRDVHPTRLHYTNGICKFNLIGLPYNFKKLLKCTNYSGHVNYSAPEIISEEVNALNSGSTFDSEDYVGEGNFTEKAETWSLGCCLYYLVTKMDPFEGASVRETKMNI
jgi:serine/threonine protein kinase